LVLGVVGPEDVFSQAKDSIDVFPLAPGLHYNYVYRYSDQSDITGHLEVFITDSGLVVYTIKGFTLVADTAIVWSVEERRTLWHTRYWFGTDTAYWIDTTTSGELIEDLAGNHTLSCSLLVWSFPLQNPVIDVHRYADSAGFLFHPLRGTAPGGYDSLWFSGSRGFYKQSLFTYSYTTGEYWHHLNIELLGNPTTVHENDFGLPTNPVLLQNYPNPFNPSTTIRYVLPARCHVILTVFNTLGQQIATLINDTQEAGYHDVRCDGSGLASGVYFYRLRAGEYLATKRLLLVR
jgi:diadenosine tetraphosphatase ApaH/serine/threonine PP2A family protein phosphatase